MVFPVMNVRSAITRYSNCIQHIFYNGAVFNSAVFLFIGKYTGIIPGTLHRMQTSSASAKITGVILALLGAFLFSAKAVLAKLVYREMPLEVINVLALRMLFSLPFYLVIFFVQYPKYKKEQHTKTPEKGLMWKAIAIGVTGYYISSFLDFSGLKYITAGLERIILFSYPALVLIFSAILYKSKIFGYQVAALIVSYAGVAVAFAGDLQHSQSGHVALGGALVFGCAITYALYVLWSGRVIPRVGASLFTSIAMISATIAIFLHFFIQHRGLDNLLELTPKVYCLLILMAVFTTVLPSLFVSGALKRIGSGNVAIISTIGPLATILQAWLMLGEPFGMLQFIGTLLVVAGVIFIGRKMSRK